MDKKELGSLIGAGAIVLGSAGVSTTSLVKSSNTSSEYQEQISALEEQIGEINNSLNSMKSDYDLKFETTNGEIVSLKAQIQSINSANEEKIEALEGEVTTLKTKVSTLETSNASLKTLVEANTSKLDDLEDDIAAQQLLIDTLSDDFDDTKLELSEKLVILNNLVTAYNELDNRIQKLENQQTRIEFETEYKKSDTEVILENAGALNAISDLSNLSEEPATFKDQELIIKNDVNLFDESFEPIKKFEGNLNGNGKTIEGLKVVSSSEGTPDYSYNALIRETTEGTKIENLTIKGANMLPYEEYEETSDAAGYPNYMGEKGILIGKTTGDTVVKGVKIEDCFATTYNNSVGGVAAEVRGGTLTVEDVTITSDVVLQAFWGTPDGCVGGVCGMVKNGAHVVIKNCDIACKIDAYNDACANYQYFNYRYCGMLCANLEGKNATTWSDSVTVENSIVTFDSWNQYRYCKNEENNKFHRINEVDGSWNEGAPETHTHGYELEGNHNKLLTFSNIFGFSTGNRQVESQSSNIIKSDDKFVDTTTVPGLTIVYLNGSENGLMGE